MSLTGSQRCQSIAVAGAPAPKDEPNREHGAIAQRNAYNGE